MAYLEDAQKAHATPLQSHESSDRTPTSPRESDSTGTAAGKQTFAERLAARGHGSPKLVAQIPATPLQSSTSSLARMNKEALRRESAGASTSRQGAYGALRTLSATERAPATAMELREGGHGTNSDASLPSFSGMANGASQWDAKERRVRSPRPRTPILEPARVPEVQSRCLRLESAPTATTEAPRRAPAARSR